MPDDRRRYRKVYCRLWIHPIFRRLPSDEKVVMLNMLTGTQTNRIGLFLWSLAKASEETNIATVKVKRATGIVCQTFGWEYDALNGVVFIPSWWKWNDVRENFKVFAGALGDINEVPDSPLIAKFLRHFTYVPTGVQYLLVGLSEKRAIPEKFSESGIQDQEQEQEMEQEQEQEQDSSAAASATPPAVSDASPAVLEFPAIGASGSIWRLTEGQVGKWQGLFPGIDVLAECRKAWAWCDVNPTKRKTAAGMSRFLVRWLSHASDDGKKGSVSRPATAYSKTAGNHASLASFVEKHQGKSHD